MTGAGASAATERMVAAGAIGVGTVLELGALAVAGCVGAVALDAIGSEASADGGCTGALVLPFLLLIAAAVTGAAGAALTLFGTVRFLRLTAPAPAS